MKRLISIALIVLAMPTFAGKEQVTSETLALRLFDNIGPVTGYFTIENRGGRFETFEVEYRILEDGVVTQDYSVLTQDVILIQDKNTITIEALTGIGTFSGTWVETKDGRYISANTSQAFGSFIGSDLDKGQTGAKYQSEVIITSADANLMLDGVESLIGDFNVIYRKVDTLKP